MVAKTSIWTKKVLQCSFGGSSCMFTMLIATQNELPPINSTIQKFPETITLFFLGNMINRIITVILH